MKKPNFYQKTVTCFLAVFLILPYVFLAIPSKANAQAEIFGQTLGELTGTVASSIVSCNAAKIQKFISNLITDSVNIDASSDVGVEVVDATMDEIVEPVPVKVTEDSRTAKDIAKNTKKTNEETKTLTKKETCWDAIMYNVARLAIKKFTVSTVRWINNGFDNDHKPFYMDPESFFNDMWDNELEGFTTDLTGLDENLFPFAKDAAKNILESYQQKFEDNAKFTLGEVITGGDTKGFSADFELGGWGGFERMLEPQNNPIGFKFMAAKKFKDSTTGLSNPLDPINSKWNSWRDEFMASGGFFSQKMCVDPPELEGKYMSDPEARGCDRWETTTPGQLISHNLINIQATGLHQAEFADEMNESVAAIFDALISYGVNQGVKALTEPGGPLSDECAGEEDSLDQNC